MTNLNFAVNFLSSCITDAIFEKKDSIGGFNYMATKRKRKKALIGRLTAKYKSRNKRTVPKVTNYLRTIRSFPDDIFYQHFRMDRSTFRKLFEEVKLFCRSMKTGRPGISLEAALYLTLWYLGNQNSFREISDRFCVSKGSAYYTTLKICKILTKLSAKYLRWPTENEHLNIIEGFNNLGAVHFPNVAGCIDGTHIPIAAPKYDACSYYNRKGFHSVLMQAICDHNLIFIDVFFGWPGRAHDASVWENSPIGKALARGEIKLPNNSHLVADSAYPLQPYIMVPYKDYGNLSQHEKKI